jgi:hypothetical protein
VIATARVLASQGTGSRGTAFAISRDLALTAFHVIGDRSNGTLHGDHVDLLFDGFPVRADVCGKSAVRTMTPTWLCFSCASGSRLAWSQLRSSQALSQAKRGPHQRFPPRWQARSACAAP